MENYNLISLTVNIDPTNARLVTLVTELMREMGGGLPAGQETSVQVPSVINETPVQEAPAPAPAALEPDYGKEYLLEVMDRTRRRIEGEDYKNNTTSELYRKYHTQLTGEFKRIAQVLGASIGLNCQKPSDLPETGIRQAFLKECEQLAIDENGNLVQNPIF